jgi:hypothetical protein
MVNFRNACGGVWRLTSDSPKISYIYLILLGIAISALKELRSVWSFKDNLV